MMVSAFIIQYFLKEVNRLYNFNGSKRKKQIFALVALILIVAMVVTSVIVALIV